MAFSNNNFITRPFFFSEWLLETHNPFSISWPNVLWFCTFLCKCFPVFSITYFEKAVLCGHIYHVKGHCAVLEDHWLAFAFQAKVSWLAVFRILKYEHSLLSSSRLAVNGTSSGFGLLVGQKYYSSEVLRKLWLAVNSSTEWKSWSVKKEICRLTNSGNNHQSQPLFILIQWWLRSWKNQEFTGSRPFKGSVILSCYNRAPK